MKKRIVVEQGLVFGRLTVIREACEHFLPSGQKQRKVTCVCLCGKVKDFFLNLLRDGTTSSCGCFQKEVGSTHKMSKHSLYRIFRGILARCKLRTATGYKNYGGRGIKCQWSSFEEFYKDMFYEYKKGLHIDRIDNDGDYCKENCRWVTPQQNLSNTRRNIKHNGITAAEASRKLGRNTNIVSERIRLGWSKERAFLQPVREFRHKRKPPAKVIYSESF